MSILLDWRLKYSISWNRLRWENDTWDKLALDHFQTFKPFIFKHEEGFIFPTWDTESCSFWSVITLVASFAALRFFLWNDSLSFTGNNNPNWHHSQSFLQASKGCSSILFIGSKFGDEEQPALRIILTVSSIFNYAVFVIYKVSLDDSFTLSGEHSCRGLGGLVLDHISTHQLRNSVQIATLIPLLSPSGGSPALDRPITTHLQQTSSLIDSQLTAASPLCAQHSLSNMPTLRHAVYLVGGHFDSSVWQHCLFVT